MTNKYSAETHTVNGVITPQQILSMHLQPIQIVPSPGKGKVIALRCAAMVLHFNSIHYSGGGDIIVYSGDQDLFVVMSHNDITSSSSIVCYTNPYSSSTYQLDMIEDTPILLKINTTEENFIAGNSVISYCITYTVISWKLPFTSPPIVKKKIDHKYVDKMSVLTYCLVLIAGLANHQQHVDNMSLMN